MLGAAAVHDFANRTFFGALGTCLIDCFGKDFVYSYGIDFDVGFGVKIMVAATRS